MRLSTCILPVRRWSEGGRQVWERAEELGFHTAYTYDHLAWRVPFRDGPWFGAIPTLTAASTVTAEIRLGTLVTSLNFRHPVTLAKELLTLDDISDGRLTLGVGAGGTGFDATALGREPWTARERADHFDEFLPLLDRLLTQDITTHRGRYYSAHEVRGVPGCVQRPRVPFAVAATGPRGMRLAARHGQSWVTAVDSRVGNDPDATPERSLREARRQVERLDAACAEEGRDPAELPRVVLTGFSPADHPTDPLGAFVDHAGAYAELGFDEMVLHWPIPDSPFAADQKAFERLATEAPTQL